MTTTTEHSGSRTDAVDPVPAQGGERLRAARRERGWSQSAAARELAALAERGGVAGATAGSLKTQLSRWENGHTTPAPEQRALLATLYERSEDELGFTRVTPPPERAGAADRLRAAVGAADAVDDEALAALAGQLRATTALDATLGTAAAYESLRAQVSQLEELADHCRREDRGAALATLVAEAAALLGEQERDRDAPDRAWAAWTTALAAAQRADRSDLADELRARRTRLLDEAGIDADPWPDAPSAERPGLHGAPVRLEVTTDLHGPRRPVRAELEELVETAVAARAAGHADTDAATRARQLALRTGSVRALALLDEAERRP
ncbi:hypothetical protein [Pseudonocardia phyllosphaerae]|uniref:hypothetical protein n=1 Tax=Pseudonocardia phyllosphaerae TaxID=3390502 RepID=UPI003979DBA2